MAGVDARETAALVGDLGQAQPLVLSRRPERYRNDVPKAEVHILDAGHFALDTAANEIAVLVQNSVDSSRSDMGVPRAG